MTSLRKYLDSLPADEQRAIEEEFQQVRRTIPLATLREDSGLTQKSVAERLGTSQAAVSRIEGRSDVLLSTLFAFTRAIGAETRVHVSLKDREYLFKPEPIEETTHHKLQWGFVLVPEARKRPAHVLIDWRHPEPVKKARQLSAFEVATNASANDEAWSLPIAV